MQEHVTIQQNGVTVHANVHRMHVLVYLYTHSLQGIASFPGYLVKYVVNWPGNEDTNCTSATAG